MKKFDRYLLKAFLYILPIVVVSGMAATVFELENAARISDAARWFYDFFGFMIGLMMLTSLYIAIRLLFSSKFRETALMKLTFVPERDEREVQLSAGAAKRALLSTLALLLLLLCLSCFQLEVTALQPENMSGGATRQISLGISFQLIDEGKIKESGGSFISYTGLPLSNTALVVGLLVWQVVVYNCIMRQSLK